MRLSAAAHSLDFRGSNDDQQTWVVAPRIDKDFGIDFLPDSGGSIYVTACQLPNSYEETWYKATISSNHFETWSVYM